MRTACGTRGTWTQGWLCDVASGSLTASFGTTLTATGSGTALTYGITGPAGGTDKAINFPSGSSQGFGGSGSTSLNINATDDFLTAIVFRINAVVDGVAKGQDFVSKLTSAFKGFEVYATGTDLAWTLTVVRSDSSSVYSSGHGLLTLSSLPVNTWVVLVACHDQTAGKMAIGWTTDGTTATTSSVAQTATSGTWSANTTSATTGVGAFGNGTQDTDGGVDIAAVYAGAGSGSASGMAANIGAAALAFASSLAIFSTTYDRTAALALTEALTIAAATKAFNRSSALALTEGLTVAASHKTMSRTSALALTEAAVVAGSHWTKNRAAALAVTESLAAAGSFLTRNRAAALSLSDVLAVAGSVLSYNRSAGLSLVEATTVAGSFVIRQRAVALALTEALAIAYSVAYRPGPKASWYNGWYGPRGRVFTDGWWGLTPDGNTNKAVGRLVSLLSAPSTYASTLGGETYESALVALETLLSALGD